jgi:hypothetical protein
MTCFLGLEMKATVGVVCLTGLDARRRGGSGLARSPFPRFSAYRVPARPRSQHRRHQSHLLTAEFCGPCRFWLIPATASECKRGRAAISCLQQGRTAAICHKPRGRTL